MCVRDNYGKRLQIQERMTAQAANTVDEGLRTKGGAVVMVGAAGRLQQLGQHQAGVWNYRGESVDISQENSNISVPLMLSSKGYGIFWNNTSRSRFNNRFANYLYISSEVADVIDYYFLYGPEFDKIIAGYRDLTGQVPMFGKWAYGFWQCKNRYKSQEELLGIARKYRALHIPADNIVQDWFWWKAEGDPVFNANFPDVPGELQQLHDEHVHAMLSVWGLFDIKSQNYQELAAKHFDVPNAHVYDSTNPEARDYYWNKLISKLFS